MDKMLSRWQPATLSLLRFVTGLLLFQFGVAKILKFPELAYFANVPPLIMAAGWIELIFGGLLMVGLFTRVVKRPTIKSPPKMSSIQPAAMISGGTLMV